MARRLPLPFQVGQKVRGIDHPTVTGIVTRIRRPANATLFSIRHNCSTDVRLLTNGALIKAKDGEVIYSISGCWTEL